MITRRGRSHIEAGLGKQARVDLGALGTPLETEPELGRALGLRAPLLVKRDDLAGPGLGGNKVRKLQYVLAEALAGGADCVVTIGAVQSNHARLTAVCGCLTGLEAYLVLGGDPDRMWGGNLTLDLLAGAHLRCVAQDDWESLDRAAAQLVAELRGDGRKPYLIPMGASMPLGAVGYAEAYLELCEQLDAAGSTADWVVTASGSGGTQAGLLAGRAVAGRGPRVIGVDVAKGAGTLRERVASLAGDCLALLGREDRLQPEDVVLVDGAGPGYGQVSDAASAAISTALRTAGLVLDPVYTAKAVAALSDLVGAGTIAPDDTVVVLHTGGAPALFAPAYAGVVPTA
ncbi:MAG: pyridoxal-phosphate dependent enzyme [Actinobacteria bacterium]|nr:pyridoxal-phosphate dependent enzyme [Actinomycetota bacterium]